MLLTGRTLFHIEKRGAVIPEEHVMFPEKFIKEGYKTFGTGKWHNSKEAYARCFTHGGRVMFGGMSDHLKVPVFDFNPEGKYPNNKKYTASGFSSEMFTDDAIRFLEKDSTKDDPFLIYVSYTAPHDPRMPPKEYLDMYPPEKIKIPENFMPEHPFDNGEMKVRDEMLAPFPRTPEIVREHIAGYYGMITHLDAQIGRLLNALEKSGKMENTIIVFAGDNGLAVGSHGLLGKQNLYDHSVRVPLVMCGPGIPKEAKADGLCYLLDIFPTLCDLSGISEPSTVEGKSLLPIINNNSTKIRNSVFLAYTKLQRGVRTDDDWKLIKYNVRGVQTTQLFNLNTDPLELNSLSDNEDYTEKLNDLTSLLRGHMKELDDFCDLDKPNWGLAAGVWKKKKVNHLAVGKKITLAEPFSSKYPGGGNDALIDGTRGTTDFKDGSWQGFEGINLDAVIDLGKIMSIRKITAGFLREQGSWIFLPESIDFSISENGKDYKTVKRFSTEKPQEKEGSLIKDFSESFKETNARYIRVLTKNIGKCPSWHKGADGKAWVFADEILVE
jgi:arylsulfatase A-like enzyme